MAPVEKEGGYGWFVAAASCLVHAVIGGIVYSTGAFHIIFRPYFDLSGHLETSLFGAALMGITALGGIPGTLLCYKFGNRATVMLGGLISATGMCLAGFLHDDFHILILFGGMTGFGFGLALTPSILILDQYFYNKRQMAANIAVTGTSIGLLCLPVATYYLEDRFAWKWTALVFAGLCLSICLCGCVMKPSNPPTGRERRVILKIFEPGLFCSSAFIAICWCNFIWSFGAAIVYTYLPEYAASTGMSLEHSIILLGVIGVSGLICRPMFQMFSESAKFDHASIILCTLLLATILTGLFPELFKQQAGQIGYAIIFGLHSAFWSTFIASVGAELIGEQHAARGRGYVFLCVALGLGGGGPFAGWVLDKKGDFEIIFYLAGTCMLVSSLLLVLINFRKVYFRPVQDCCDAQSDSVSSGSGHASNERLEESPLVTTKAETVRAVLDPRWVDAPETAV